MPAKSEHVNRDGPLGAFGALVLRGRQSRGWTVRDLARASGVGQNACSTAERGLHDMRLTTALKLAAALGIDLMAVGATNGDTPAAAPAPPEPAGKLARVEVKGFRDLGVVRVSETTLGGEPMLHAERTPWSARDFQGDAADFPPSSLHFITWLPEGAVAKLSKPAALTDGRCPCGEPKDVDGECPGSWHGCQYHNEGEDEDGEPF